MNSGIYAKYSVASKPSFSAGVWSVYSAKKKGSGGADASDHVSVFVFDKKWFVSQLVEGGISRKVAEEVYERLRKEVSNLSKIRHPSVVRIVEPLEESKSSLVFVTENLSGCLKGQIDAKKQHSSGADDELDELVVQRGLLQICDGLIFLHETAGYVHMNLEPSSVVIDAKGDWKLFGLKFARSYKDGPAEFFTEQVDPRLSKLIQINYDYAAPELLLDHKLDPSNDIFSLGCLILCIYNASGPLQTGNNLYEYKDQLRTMSRALRNPSIPAYFSNILPQLIKTSPMERISIQSLKTSEFFNNPLVKTINFLDDFPGKLASEKKVFLQGLEKILPQFPKSTRQKKILQSLLEELGKDEDVVYLLLRNILAIGAEMSQLGFAEKILTAIAKVKDQPGCQAAILDSLDVFLSRLSEKDFEASILPVLVLVLQASDPEHQRQVLASMKSIVEKLNYLAMKTEIFPATCDLFSKTTSLSVKLECLKAFSVFITHELDKFTVTEKLIPLMSKMKTRESQIIMTALDVYLSLVNVVDIEVLATQIIPQILALSMEVSLHQQQFRQLMDSVRKILEKIETEKIKKLPTGSSTPLNSEKGFATSASLSAGSKTNDDFSFDDLINKPTNSTGASNSLAAMNNSNDDKLTNSFQDFGFSANLSSGPVQNTVRTASSTQQSLPPPLQPMNTTPMNQLMQNNSMNGYNGFNQANSAQASTNINFAGNTGSSFGATQTITNNVPSFGATQSMASFKPLNPSNVINSRTQASNINWGSTAIPSSTNDFGDFQKSPTTTNNNANTFPSFPKPGTSSTSRQSSGTNGGALDQYQSLL